MSVTNYIIRAETAIAVLRNAGVNKKLNHC